MHMSGGVRFLDGIHLASIGFDLNPTHTLLDDVILYLSNQASEWGVSSMTMYRLVTLSLNCMTSPLIRIKRLDTQIGS